MADALCKSTGSLSANFDKAGIAGDLIECWQGALRLREKLVVEVSFELQESVIDAEAIVFHAAFK